ASTTAGFPRKNWMPAFAGMTFPCLYVALLVLLHVSFDTLLAIVIPAHAGIQSFARPVAA
ncbi:MAG: hypothetical protein WAV22_10655, partial [Porticoccaceae bacterium]